jgi:LPS-assembly lipoprotein
MIGLPLARFLAPAMIALGLSGCIQPVHTPRIGSGSSRVSALLAEVSVERVEGYLGYNLKSELDFLLTGGAAPTSGGRFLLKVKTKQSSAATIIDQQTGRAQIATLQVEAVYVLVDQKEKGRIRASGKTYASASFDRSQQRYATLRAQRDAEERVAKALAERLKIIVTSALVNDGASAGAGQTPELSPSLDDPEAAPAADPGDET